MPQVTEIRPGTGVFNDMNTVQGDFCSLANCAGAIVCTVANNEVWGQVVLDAGAKTLTIDRSGNTAVSPLARGINAASNLLYTQSAMLLSPEPLPTVGPGGRRPVAPTLSKSYGIPDSLYGHSRPAATHCGHIRSPRPR